MTIASSPPAAGGPSTSSRTRVPILLLGGLLIAGLTASCGMEPEPGEQPGDDEQQTQQLGGAEPPCRGNLCPRPDPWEPNPPKPVECKQMQVCDNGTRISCEANQGVDNRCQTATHTEGAGRKRRK